MAAGNPITRPDPDTYGVPASAVWDTRMLFPGPVLPSLAGSTLGVPPGSGIAGETPGAAGTSNPVDYGASKAGAPAHAQPVFWLVVLVVVGVMFLSHTARLSLRGGGG